MKFKKRGNRMKFNNKHFIILSIIWICALLFFIFSPDSMGPPYRKPEDAIEVSADIPKPEDVIEISVAMNGESKSLPTTGSFVLPSNFHAEVRRYLSGKTTRWYPEGGFAGPVLGQIRFKTRSSKNAIIYFYDAGPGCLGYSLNNKYYIVRMLKEKEDGAVALLWIFEGARSSMLPDASQTDGIQ